MKGLIRFWQAQLKEHRWSMDETTREMIRETINVLRSTVRERVKPQVIREAEAVSDRYQHPGGKA